MSIVCNLNGRRPTPTQLFPYGGLSSNNSGILSKTIKYPCMASAYINIMVWDQKPGDRTVYPGCLSVPRGPPRPHEAHTGRVVEKQAFALRSLCLQMLSMDSFPVIGPSLALGLEVLSLLSSGVPPGFGGGTVGMVVLYD